MCVLCRARLLPLGMDKMNLFLCSLDVRFLEMKYTRRFWIRNNVCHGADYTHTGTARTLPVEQSIFFIRRSYASNT